MRPKYFKLFDEQLQIGSIVEIDEMGLTTTVAVMNDGNPVYWFESLNGSRALGVYPREAVVTLNSVRSVLQNQYPIDIESNFHQKDAVSRSVGIEKPFLVAVCTFES